MTETRNLRNHSTDAAESSTDDGGSAVSGDVSGDAGNIINTEINSQMDGKEFVSEAGRNPIKQDDKIHEDNNTSTTLTKPLLGRTVRLPCPPGATTKKCLLTLDGYSYVIVASTPENLIKREDNTKTAASNEHPPYDINTTVTPTTSNQTPGCTCNNPHRKDYNPNTEFKECNCKTTARVQEAAILSNVETDISGHSLTIVRRSNSRRNIQQIDTNLTVLCDLATDEKTDVNTSSSNINIPDASESTDIPDIIAFPQEHYPLDEIAGTTADSSRQAFDNTSRHPLSKEQMDENSELNTNTNLDSDRLASINTAASTASGVSLQSDTTTNDLITSHHYRSKSIKFFPPSTSTSTSSPIIDCDLTTDNLPPVDTPDACDKASVRLRCLLKLLSIGEVSTDILKTNLQYAALVLEAVYVDESNKIAEKEMHLYRKPRSTQTHTHKPEEKGGERHCQNINTVSHNDDNNNNNNKNNNKNKTDDDHDDGLKGKECVKCHSDKYNLNCDLHYDPTVTSNSTTITSSGKPTNLVVNSQQRQQEQNEDLPAGVTLNKNHTNCQQSSQRCNILTEANATAASSHSTTVLANTSRNGIASTSCTTKPKAIIPKTKQLRTPEWAKSTTPTKIIKRSIRSVSNGFNSEQETTIRELSPRRQQLQLNFNHNQQGQDPHQQQQQRHHQEHQQQQEQQSRYCYRTNGKNHSYRNHRCRSTGRFSDEDDELSEVQPDAVPPEVREWLASTFTRQLATSRQRGDDKPKFRTVAHAIRAGIFVDRIYRRISGTGLLQFPPEVVQTLKGIDDWSFDVFELADAAKCQPVKYIGCDLLNRYGIIRKFKITPAILDTFLSRIEEGYCRYRNPYHNNIHAADVTQTVHSILCQTGLMNWLTDLEIYATILAAIIHDYEHTGTTNNFHVMSGSDTAMLYNDKAVLENHHVSAAFRLLKNDDCNILANLSREEYRELRTLVIDMVLSTDMSYHFSQLKTIRNSLTVNDATVDKSKALALVLHCCDISHPAKRWNLHHRWTMLLLEEFFRQGDLESELNLPFSPLCDRKNTLVAESQIGFIDFIVDPSMSVMSDMLEHVLLPLAPMCKKVNASIDAGDSPLDTEPNYNTSSTSEYPKRRPSPSKPQQQADDVTNKSIDDGLEISNINKSSKVRFTIHKPWIACLTENKKIWKEQAIKDAENRRETSACEDVESINN